MIMHNLGLWSLLPGPSLFGVKKRSQTAMGDLQVIGGMKKLNSQNYNTWSTCMESYLQGQDLWEIVGGDEVEQPKNVTALKQ